MTGTGGFGLNHHGFDEEVVGIEDEIVYLADQPTRSLNVVAAHGQATAEVGVTFLESCHTRRASTIMAAHIILLADGSGAGGAWQLLGLAAEHGDKELGLDGLPMDPDAKWVNQASRTGQGAEGIRDNMQGLPVAIIHVEIA